MSAPLILLVTMVAVIALRIWGRVHAFLSLLAGALLVGVLSPLIPLDTVPGSAAAALGRVCGSIAIVIALAAVIGECLLDSGAAERISRRFLRLFGESRGHFSLWGSGYVLSVPVFFDTVFYLLLPLARAMTARQGRNDALNLSAVAVGGAATHVFVPPAPGPLAVASGLGVDPGLMILMGLLVALPASLVALGYAIWRERRSPSTTRSGSSFGLSILPIALPVLLIAGRTGAEAAGANPAVLGWVKFFGDPNMALMISAVVALWLAR